MHLTEGNCYHIYNRGNQKQQLFFSEANYIYFLKKVKQHISPVADILSWCLMPNHFHLLVHATEESVEPIVHGKLQSQRFSDGIRMVLSSYTKAINKQEGRTGNLFQQRTKAKEVSRSDEQQLLIAFHYIHQNPLKAKLVSRMEDWQFSSFRDYAGLREGKLCNKLLAKEITGINFQFFYEDSYKAINSELIIGSLNE